MKLGIEGAVFARRLEEQLRDIEAALVEAGKSATVVDLDQARTGRLARRTPCNSRPWEAE